jgi:hypothetical protein
MTDIFLVFLLHSCIISYSSGVPFVPDGIISVSFTSRVRYSTGVEQENLKDVSDETLIIPSGTNGSPEE